ncbi:MAG TPA: DUF418 domain-containing protein [Gammaproteobacteria bacterium]|nr:DUF418 domain-containing protein [Gammaproteobacteria bacterium]
MSNAKPTELRERIFTLDAIRGFALLGIFIMNMPGFSASLFQGADGTHMWPEWWDRTAEVLRDVLFSGKFNSMFSMLFAIGFILLLERLEARDSQHATAIYLRRIGWLLVLGVIHACVFWTGDVLHMYALFGVALLALRRVPEKWLWALFVVSLLYPVAWGLYRLLTTSPEETQAMIALLAQWEASNNVAYGTGSFLAAAREHFREMVFLYTDPRPLLNFLAGFYVQLFTTMVLGLILGRRHFFQNAASHIEGVKRVQWAALAIGVLTGAIYGYYEATVTDPLTPTALGATARLAYVLCRVATMTFYVATIVRAVQSVAWRRFLAPIATVGRMPLTNYLLQTLLATFIFYGWGLGFWGKVGPALQLLLAIAIYFIIQVPLSRWWLNRFTLGPMEYLWRVLTYGRASLRAAPSGASATV